MLLGYCLLLWIAIWWKNKFDIWSHCHPRPPPSSLWRDKKCHKLPHLQTNEISKTQKILFSRQPNKIGKFRLPEGNYITRPLPASRPGRYGGPRLGLVGNGSMQLITEDVWAQKMLILYWRILKQKMLILYWSMELFSSTRWRLYRPKWYSRIRNLVMASHKCHFNLWPFPGLFLGSFQANNQIYTTISTWKVIHLVSCWTWTHDLLIKSS